MTYAVVAAAIIVLVAAAHSYLGERFILMRLFRRADLPHLFGSDVFTKRTLRFAWHITTVTWLGMAVVLIQLGRGEPAATFGYTLAATSAACGVVALVGARGRHLSWVAFFAVAVLIWLAVRP